MPLRRFGLRRSRVRNGLLMLTVLCVGVFTVSACKPATRSTPHAITPAVGLISPMPGQLNALARTSVSRVVMSARWVEAEPLRGVFDPSVFASLRAAISQAHAKGLDVVLDLGLQYPPAWVFGVGGQTRFVNQYGDVWHGQQSQDVPNAVFNPAVQAAEAGYITHLAAAIGPHAAVSIRVGGLLSGELRYPVAKYNGHTLSLWMYDPAAQAHAPYPGWRPGTGTTTAAKASLAYYFASLTRYQTWLMTTVNRAFPNVDQQIMFPSWGLRPGYVSKAITAGLHNTTTAEVNGLISEGLDWTNQVKAITTAGIRGTVYSTWLDAPSQGTTPAQIPPVQYLATLATAYHLPVAGENTGGGGQTALNLIMRRATTNHLTSVMYMSGQLIGNGSAGVTLTQLKNAAQGVAGSG